MKLSVVIPLRNEEKGVARVVERLLAVLQENRIDAECILVNDCSQDNTPRVLRELAARHAQVRCFDSPAPHGFGIAIRAGLAQVSGEAVVIFMGDASDQPEDVVLYYRTLQEGYDCVFGSRFIRGSRVSGYPLVKLIFNRAGNLLMQWLFWVKYNDISNAFKAYRIGVIRAVQPLVSQYFNITVEIPLKAIIRGFSYAVVPIQWQGRESGISKYHIRVLGRKYFFSILFVWLERILLDEEIARTRHKG